MGNDLWSQLVGKAGKAASTASSMFTNISNMGLPTPNIGLGSLGNQLQSLGGYLRYGPGKVYADNGGTGGGQVLPASTVAPASPGGTGAVARPAGATTTPTNGYDVTKESQNRADQLSGQNADMQAKMREGISSAYDPIFAELDRQIGMTPDYKTQLSNDINTLASQQTTDVNSQQARDVASIEGGKTTETNTAKSSLRNLEDDVRNIIQATALYLGSRGAGDSSAGGAASEAITSVAQKARSGVLQTRDQALGVLDQKIADVNASATDQIRKIGDWKTNKLSDITKWAVDRVDQLNAQKANASGAKANAIANMITQTETQFYDALKQLDDSVYNYKQSVATWQQQRAADLEDFKTKLGIQSQYTTNTPAQYKVVTDAFGRTFAVNPTNPSDVVNISGDLGAAGTGATKKPNDVTSLGLGSALGINPTVQ